MTARIVIAAPESGSGKTTVTAGLMKALTDKGLRVQGFKVGPDYIDPQCHRWATGRPSRNLDTWLMTAAQVQGVFRRGAIGADIAVIEGVMGLYDGADGGTEIGSTAYLAKLLGAPVVLVIDANASARSAAAVALGFKLFDPAVPLAGVICNRVAGPGHAAMLRAAFEAVGIPLLGAVYQDPALGVPEERLGLALPGGDETLPDWIGRAGAAVAERVDLDRLLALAAAPETALGRVQADDPFAPAQAGRFDGLRLAVALDPAFWFYYADTLDLLQHWGVDLYFFSPLWGDELPPQIDGLYLGGGFPERHARELAANERMRDAVRARMMLGLPMLAECGGYLYLLDGLTGEDGVVYPMVGAIPGVAHLQDRLQGMGYRTAEPGGVKGHLFHYTRIEGGEGGSAWRLYHAGGAFDRVDGYRQGNLLASYLHIHHGTEPRVMAQFLAECLRYRREK
ncbi:MAG: cobyrinate a,c-diamide synthase [Mycobacterium leprae]